MPKAAKDPRETTVYEVLARPDEGNAFNWTQLGSYTAVTADDAKKQAAKANEEGFKTFVAVPARSWKPSTRTVEQVTKERWS
jgi:hypothetical protein